MSEENKKHKKHMVRLNEDVLIDLNPHFLYKIKRGFKIIGETEYYTLEVHDSFGRTEIVKYEEENERDEYWIMVDKFLRDENVEIHER